MAELAKKKLINEYDRYDSDGVLEKKNSNIPSEVLAYQSIEGIVTDPENRTLWINGMPFGNAYSNYVETDETNTAGPFHAEVFNDFETNVISNNSDYSHVEGRNNTLESDSVGSHIEGGTDATFSNNETIKVNRGNTISGSKYAHAEGAGNNISDSSHFSHVEGINNTITNSLHSHVSGKNNTASSANNSTIVGKGNKVYNENEVAVGEYNYSKNYVLENGNNAYNESNKTIVSVGIGDNNYEKNAVRVNKDGAVYLSSITKTTDKLVETFDPCNYSGQSIYRDNKILSGKKDLISKSVQEVLSGIGHMESITYWRLRTLAESNKLLPGKSYRIIDYNPGLNDFYNKPYTENDVDHERRCILSSQSIDPSGALSENPNYLNRFDIVVTAISESEFSQTAKAIAHDFSSNVVDNTNELYFSNTNFNKWEIGYDVFSTEQKYDWVNPSVTESKIRISFPHTSIIKNYLSNWFRNETVLSSYVNTDGDILSQKYYSSNNGVITNKYLELVSPVYGNPELKNIIKYEKITEDEKIKWTPVIKSGNYVYATEDIPNVGEEFTDGSKTYKWDTDGISPVNINPFVYTYEGIYFYNCPQEEDWFNINVNSRPAVNDTNRNEGACPYTTGDLQSYNYKWILDINSYEGSTINSKFYEYCVLTSDVDFSYMQNNNKKLTSNMLFCKNDKSLDITKYDGVTATPKYYETPTKYPYVIEVQRTILKDNETKNVYNAFVYGGPYYGEYNEIPEEEVTKDIWYRMTNYNPSLGTYFFNKDEVGTISFLVDRQKDTDGTITYPNFTDWESLRDFVREPSEESTGRYNFFKREHESIKIADTIGDFIGQPNCYYSVSTDNEGNEILTIQYEGEAYNKSNYRYTYNDKSYVIWAQTKTTAQDITAFIITNPDAENPEDVNFNNVFDMYIIHVPIRYQDYAYSISGMNILEQEVLAITAQNNTIDINGETLPISAGCNNHDYLRSGNQEFDNDRYYVIYNLTNAITAEYDKVYSGPADENVIKLHRFKVQYTLNIQFETDSETSLSDNFEAIYNFEQCLLPICYVELDTSSNDYFVDGKYASTGVIYRMVDEFGNEAPYDFKNIKFYNGSDVEGNPMLSYSYTFDGVISSDSVEEPYTDYSKIGDKSLTGTILNNKIINTNNTTYSLPNIFFRLTSDSSLINNTFINCINMGGQQYEESQTKGVKLVMSNNIFKDCYDLDFSNFNNFSNNYFYDVTGKIHNNETNVGNSLVNSTINGCIFGKNNKFNDINIVNSKLIDCGNLSATYGTEEILHILNSNIIDSVKNADKDLYRLQVPGINFNGNYHELDGSTDDGLTVKNSGNLTFNVDSTNTGYIKFAPTTNFGTSSAATATASIANTYTQSFSCTSSGFYKVNNCGGSSRDNGQADAPTTTFTFTFNKNTAETTYGDKNGYYYAFPVNDKADRNNSGVYDDLDSYENAYISLGTFFVKHYWDMYTFWGQSKSVYASAYFKCKLDVYYYNAGDNVGAPVSRTIESWNGMDGYWSQSTWSTYYYNSKIDLTKLDKITQDGITLYENGKFIISANGKKRIQKIVLTFNGYTYADSTGANNCVGNVYISSLYHTNSSLLLSSEKSTAKGNYTATTTESPYIYYYKPTIYSKADAGKASDHTFYMNKNGLVLQSKSTTKILYISTDNYLCVGTLTPNGEIEAGSGKKIMFEK